MRRLEGSSEVIGGDRNVKQEYILGSTSAVIRLKGIRKLYRKGLLK